MNDPLGKGAFGRADGEVLTGIERAPLSGRRITSRRARRQKRSQQSARGFTVGRWSVAPIVAVGIAVALIAGVAGAAVLLGGGHSTSKRAIPVTTSPRAASSTSPPSTSVGPAAGVYVRFADAAKTIHYMYCTVARGCGLLDVATNGSSKVTAVLVAGVWHLEQRVVIQHDPCINIVQNGVKVGKPGDLVRVTTTDVHPAGTKTIKGVRVPARIAGTISVHTETPEQPGCTFSGTPDFSRNVDSPVTEYVPVAG